MTLADDMNAAWAAGLFEGEGCIHVSRKNNGKYVRVVLTVAMSDLDIVNRFADLVEVGTIKIRPPKQSHHKPSYAWSVTGRACKPILERFLPFFGERRSMKSLEALSLLTELGIPNHLKTHCPQGHEYTADNIYLYRGGRRCRACGVAQNRKARSRGV